MACIIANNIIANNILYFVSFICSFFTFASMFVCSYNNSNNFCFDDKKKISSYLLKFYFNIIYITNDSNDANNNVNDSNNNNNKIVNDNVDNNNSNNNSNSNDKKIVNDNVDKNNNNNNSNSNSNSNDKKIVNDNNNNNNNNNNSNSNCKLTDKKIISISPSSKFSWFCMCLSVFSYVWLCLFGCGSSLFNSSHCHLDVNSFSTQPTITFIFSYMPLDSHFGERNIMPLDSHFGERNAKQKYFFREYMSLDSHFGERNIMSLDSHFGERNTKQKYISKLPWLNFQVYKFYDHYFGRSSLVRTSPKNVLGCTSKSKKSFVLLVSFYNHFSILVRTFPKNVPGYTSKSKNSCVFQNYSPYQWPEHFPKCSVCRAFALSLSYSRTVALFLSHSRAVALSLSHSHCVVVYTALSLSFYRAVAFSYSSVVIYFLTHHNIKSLYSKYCHFCIFSFSTLYINLNYHCCNKESSPYSNCSTKNNLCNDNDNNNDNNNNNIFSNVVLFDDGNNYVFVTDNNMSSIIYISYSKSFLSKIYNQIYRLSESFFIVNTYFLTPSNSAFLCYNSIYFVRHFLTLQAYFPNIYDRFFGPSSQIDISSLTVSTEQPTTSSNFYSSNIAYSNLFEFDNNIDDDNSSDVDEKTSEEKKVNDNNEFDLPPSEQPNIDDDNSIDVDKKTSEENNSEFDLPPSEQPNIDDDNSIENNSEFDLPPSEQPNIDDDNSIDVDKKTSEEKKVNCNNEFDHPTSKQTSSPSHQPRTPASKRTPSSSNNTGIILFPLFDSNQNNFSTFTVREGISILLDHFTSQQQPSTTTTTTSDRQQSMFINIEPLVSPSFSWLCNCYLSFRPLVGSSGNDNFFVPQFYAKQLCIIFFTTRSSSVNCPCDSNVKFTTKQQPSSNAEQKTMLNYPYRKLIGSLLYLLGTRPELYLIIISLSRFVNNSGFIHWLAALRVLFYVCNTPFFGLLIRPNQFLKLKVYVDADHGGNLDDRKSVSGYIIYLGSIFSVTKHLKHFLFYIFYKNNLANISAKYISTRAYILQRKFCAILIFVTIFLYNFNFCYNFFIQCYFLFTVFFLSKLIDYQLTGGNCLYTVSLSTQYCSISLLSGCSISLLIGSLVH